MAKWSSCTREALVELRSVRPGYVASPFSADSAVEKGGYWNLFKNFPKLADNCRIEFKETKYQILYFCSCHRIDF